MGRSHTDTPCMKQSYRRSEKTEKLIDNKWKGRQTQGYRRPRPKYDSAPDHAHLMSGHF